MKATAKVLATKDNLAKIQLDTNELRPGEIIAVRWGEKRSRRQNNLYWRYLNWCINEGGLKDQGHFCAEALHIDLKAHFLSEKIFDEGTFKTVEIGSTTDLSTKEFKEYLEKVDNFLCDFFGIDTSAFWEAHGEDQQGGRYGEIHEKEGEY